MSIREWWENDENGGCLVAIIFLLGGLLAVADLIWGFMPG